MFSTEIKIVLRRGIMSKENKTQPKHSLFLEYFGQKPGYLFVGQWGKIKKKKCAAQKHVLFGTHTN